MSERPFRFVHASDFQLDRPIQGLTEIPDHLRELLVEAPLRAATRVFDLAIAERADFVILSGNLIDVRCCTARSVLFLVEQFARLEAEQIVVYWAGSPSDLPEDWPAPALLPGNVHPFPTRRPEEVLHETPDGLLARLLGWSRPSRRKLRPKDFAGADDGLFTIAVANGSAPRELLAERNIDYWALGGSPARANVLGRPHLAHAPGSPQARDPQHAGAHGCTIVHVDSDHRLKLVHPATDALRFHTARIDVDPGQTRAGLEERFAASIKNLREEAGAVEMLVRWEIAGSGPLLAQLRRGRMAGEMLTWLRGTFAHQSPGVWSLAIDVEAQAAVPGTWYEEDTLRGDFLRSGRNRLQQTTAEGEPVAIDLTTYLGQRNLTHELSAAAHLEGDELRRALREAALLGAGMLSGGEEQT